MQMVQGTRSLPISADMTVYVRTRRVTFALERNQCALFSPPIARRRHRAHTAPNSRKVLLEPPPLVPVKQRFDGTDWKLTVTHRLFSAVTSVQTLAAVATGSDDSNSDSDRDSDSDVEGNGLRGGLDGSVVSLDEPAVPLPDITAGTGFRRNRMCRRRLPAPRSHRGSQTPTAHTQLVQKEISADASLQGNLRAWLRNASARIPPRVLTAVMFVVMVLMLTWLQRVMWGRLSLLQSF
jgi:hypothetical protein